MAYLMWLKLLVHIGCNCGMVGEGFIRKFFSRRSYVRNTNGVTTARSRNVNVKCSRYFRKFRNVVCYTSTFRPSVLVKDIGVCVSRYCVILVKFYVIWKWKSNFVPFVGFFALLRETRSASEDRDPEHIITRSPNPQFFFLFRPASLFVWWAFPKRVSTSYKVVWIVFQTPKLSNVPLFYLKSE